MKTESRKIIDSSPRINVEEAEYKRLLGLPREYVMDGRTQELADWARDWYGTHGRPWIYLRQAEHVSTDKRSVMIDGISFPSEGLLDLLGASRADHAYYLAVSAGKECEAYAHTLWQEERPDEYFFLEIFGSAVVEYLVAQAAFRLCAWADEQGLTVLPHLSPGYTGWDIGDQPALMQAIREGDRHGLPGELGVLPTGMLSPKKSLLGIFPITRASVNGTASPGLIPCERCSLTGCTYRRIPYAKHLPLTERLPGPERHLVPGERQKPVYTVREKALATWAKNRLSLYRSDDGSIQASFRYTGTTCTNMGTPIDFRYIVSLSPASDGHRILDAHCQPDKGDWGHLEMCEYRDSGGGLMKEIAREHPLIGKPLRDIFSWKRAFSPSGCFCNEASRTHKWGIAYEVIAYALAQEGDAWI